MTTMHPWRVAAMWVPALGFLVSCGSPSGPSVSVPIASPKTSTPSQLTVSTRCFGPLRTGASYGLACVAEVSDTAAAPTSTYSVQADLGIFGGAAQVEIPRCRACGGPPWTFDIDLQIPADITPGVKRFAVWVTDTGGRRADTTAVVTIVAP